MSWQIEVSELPKTYNLAEWERTIIRACLKEHNENRTHAAKALGISVRTLQRKIKQPVSIVSARY